MDAQKVDMFLISNAKNFETTQIPFIKEKLLALDDSCFLLVSSADYKSPTTLLVVSLLVGGLGVDRFMLGDIGMGILKLLTGGCFGILTIIDWFNVMKKTRQKNFEEFMQIVAVNSQHATPYNGQYNPVYNAQYKEQPVNQYNNNNTPPFNSI